MTSPARLSGYRTSSSRPRSLTERDGARATQSRAVVEVTPPPASTSHATARPADGQTAGWVDSLVLAFDRIADLQPGWDGARAKIPTQTVVRAGLSVVLDLGTDVIVPVVSPTSDGGVVLEWRRGDLSIDVWVDPDGHRTVDYQRGDNEWDGDWDDKRVGVRLALVTETAPPAAL